MKQGVTEGQMLRHSGRTQNDLRSVSFERNYTCYAEGAVLATCGFTKVLCTATIENKVPPFLKGTDQGWITAEYAMLPRATDQRTQRVSRSGISGRSAEIQRLIGRSLRAAVNMNLLGAYTITIDCDVIQADGGTRTTAINGGFVALVDALRFLVTTGSLCTLPLVSVISAVSAGKIGEAIYLDLDSAEDRAATVDFNVVMNQADEFVELQGTGEKGFFSRVDAAHIFDLCAQGCSRIRDLQLAALDFSEGEKRTLVF